jgi:putative transposase
VENIPVESMKSTKKHIEFQIYQAFEKLGMHDVRIADILRELDFSMPLDTRFNYSVTALLKALVLKRLKEIRSQSELARHLKSHEQDSLKLGFFRDRNNRLETPDQRTFSYFIKNHMDNDKRELVEFVVKKIEAIADKFGIVLDSRALSKEDAPTTEGKSTKTFYNQKNDKLKDLCKLIRKKIYPKIKLEIRNNSIYNKSDFLNLLLHLALTEDFAENGSRTLEQILHRRTPTSDTLLYHIKKFEDKEILQNVFIKIFDLIFKMAKRGNFFNHRKVDVAIDYTDWFYYGKNNNLMILGKKPEKGTTKCFRFATINIVEHGQRFTLLALPVSAFERKEQILEKLISFAKERVTIRKLYADRGFFSSNVINLFKKMHVTFLMPAIKNDRIIDYANSVSPPSIIKDYPMQNCKFNLVILEKEDRRYAFATNMNFNNSDVMLAERIFTPYSKRWGIETSYRVKKNFRGKTTSRNYIVRQFYFMFSVVIYNLWVFVNLLISMFLYGKISKKLIVTAKLFGTFLFFIDPGRT